jgi:hypothetical protein
VASDALFDEKSATLAILIFQQLGYLFAKTKSSAPSAPTGDEQAVAIAADPAP